MKDRLTKRDEEWYWKNEEYWVSAEEPTDGYIDKIYYALAKYENFMEQNGFASLEELSKELSRNFVTSFNEVSKVHNLINDNPKMIIKLISDIQTENEELKKEMQKLKSQNYNLARNVDALKLDSKTMIALQLDRNTWKKACELACEKVIGYEIREWDAISLESAELAVETFSAKNFYEQAQEELKGE